jgi:pyridoxamine 5'-phosphate oxidase
VIKFNNLCKEKPYSIFKKKYDESLKAHQLNIEAMCISSYSNELKEVNARFVNLKSIDKKNFIFFSNYLSPKAKEFHTHSQITALIYWNSTNTQIRLKANIEKTSTKFNETYFLNRDKNKNALSISSNQSLRIESYGQVKENYNKSLMKNNLDKCPNYWGGFSFEPYYFEFWKGHGSRLNERDVYELKNGNWNNYTLEP